ncbi:MAG: hypothetical protein ACE5JT_03085 [Nitrosopumilaceae archaeon]
MIVQSLTLEVSTANYEDDRELVSLALEELQSLCKTTDGFLLSKPMSKFGWSFFKILFKANLLFSVQENLGDMIERSKGRRPEQKLTQFISDFFESRGCNVRLKAVDF